MRCSRAEPIDRAGKEVDRGRQAGGEGLLQPGGEARQVEPARGSSQTGNAAVPSIVRLGVRCRRASVNGWCKRISYIRLVGPPSQGERAGQPAAPDERRGLASSSTRAIPSRRAPIPHAAGLESRPLRPDRLVRLRRVVETRRGRRGRPGLEQAALPDRGHPEGTTHDVLEDHPRRRGQGRARAAGAGHRRPRDVEGPAPRGRSRAADPGRRGVPEPGHQRHRAGAARRPRARAARRGSVARRHPGRDHRLRRSSRRRRSASSPPTT